MSDRNLILLFGGRSSEHEISLLSARSVLKALSDTDLEVFPIWISRTGAFYLCSEPDRICDGSFINSGGHLTPVYPIQGGFLVADTQTPLPNAVVFPCLHGEYCEDGRIQGMLELFGIPYIGSGATSSAICFDKSLTKERLRRFGIPLADWVSLDIRTDSDLRRLLSLAEAHFPYPVFVKPARGGSSIGARPAHSTGELEEAIRRAAAVDPRVLVEPLIKGREIEVSILGGNSPIAAPAAEPIHCADYYDYDAKYRGGGARIRIPAELSADEAGELSELALRIFNILDCRHLARVDFFVTSNGEILFNEINTLPGMTEMSVYPRALAEIGYPIPRLLRYLAEAARAERR